MNARGCVVAALLGAWLAGCGADDAIDDTGSGGSGSSGVGGGTAEETLGPDGGTVDSDDGVLTLVVPAGALQEDVSITITQAGATPGTTPPGSFGPVFEIGPSGTTFATPATVFFHLDEIDLADTDPTSLRIATVVDGAWQTLDEPQYVDVELSGTTSHLSPFGLITQVCGDTAAGSGCDAGGGCPPTPRCADGDPCGGPFPGATLSSCADTADGFDAVCCFAPDVPVCVTEPAFGLACESSTPCSTVAGSSVDSCTNTPDGYTAVCCLPPGTPLPEEPSGGGGGDPPGG